MANVQMKAYKVRELVFQNKIQGKVQLKLSNKVSHNVRYMQPDLCEGTMTVEVFDKEQPDVLNVKVTVTGLFQIKKQVEKEFLHVDTFRELFPFAKAMVTTVSANAGIQPIMVQDVDIESQEIYRFDLPKRRPKEADET